MLNILFKNGPNPASFCLFRSFYITNISLIDYNDKSIDGVLGTQTRGGRMVGTDESTELWRPPPHNKHSLHCSFHASQMSKCQQYLLLRRRLLFFFGNE